MQEEIQKSQLEIDEKRPLIDTLREIANSFEVPASCGALAYQNITFGEEGCWRIVVFYDGEDFDYIDHFINPNGDIVDYWDWPDCKEKVSLINWRPKSI